jgi:hypothetical protein
VARTYLLVRVTDRPNPSDVVTGVANTSSMANRPRRDSSATSLECETVQ